MRRFCAGVAIATSFISVGQIAHAQVNPGVFFDWSTVHNAIDPNTPRFTPMPHPGSEKPGLQTHYGALFNSLPGAGHPTSFMIRESAAPITGQTTSTPGYPGSPPRKNTVDDMLAWVPTLNYVASDIEHGATSDEADMTAIVNKVRASTNPAVSGAYIGNYGYWKGTVDSTTTFPSQSNMTARDAAYTNSQVNTSYPNCYAYSSMMQHAQEWASWPAGNRTPDRKTALFWAPLERMSAAKRNLPAGHKIIPFVGVYIPVPNYWAPVPEKADYLALIQHYRMRGSDGIFVYNTADGKDPDPNTVDANNDASYKWTSDPAIPIQFVPTAYRDTYFVPHNSWLYTYTATQHRSDIVDKWDDLDSMFGTPIRTLLNLNTTKTTGVEWSGVRSVNTVNVLVSNLSSMAQTVNLTGTDYAYNGGIPTTTGSVAAGTHQMFSYTMTNLIANPDFDANIAGWYLLLGSTRDTTGGVSGSACIKTQNTSMAAVGTQNIRTEPGAKMSIKVSAKGVSAPWLKLGFYTYDAAGNNISFFTAGDHTNVSTSFTNYTSNFTVPNNAAIKYVRPIIYNFNAPTDSADVLYVDDVVVKFEP